jgi:hypothetical protein
MNAPGASHLGRFWFFGQGSSCVSRITTRLSFFRRLTITAFDAVFLRIVAVPTRPIDIASQNLFDIMNTTRAMRRAKPDPLQTR